MCLALDGGWDVGVTLRGFLGWRRSCTYGQLPVAGAVEREAQGALTPRKLYLAPWEVVLFLGLRLLRWSKSGGVPW